MFRLFLLLSLMAITFSYNISLPKSSSSEDISDEWYPENSSEEFRDYSNFTAVPIVPRSGRHDIIEKKDELSIEVIIIASVTGCCAFIAVVVGAVGYAAKQRQRARAVQIVKYLNLSPTNHGVGTPTTPQLSGPRMALPTSPNYFEEVTFLGKPAKVV